MRILVKSFLLVLITINCTFGQKAFVQKLDSLCTVTLPDTPKIKSAGPNTAYFVNTQKERYIALVQAFDKETIGEFKDHLPSFYSGVIDGVLEASNTKGTLIYKKDIVINGIQGIEFEYQSTLNPQVPDIRYQILLFFNNKLFNLSYWVFNGNIKEKEQNKIQFFNSFHINTNKKANN